MKKMICWIILCILVSGCTIQQAASDPLNASSISTAESSSTSVIHSKAEEASSSAHTPTLPLEELVPGLPAQFDPFNEITVRDYFLYLLTTGNTFDTSSFEYSRDEIVQLKQGAIDYCNKAYLSSCFNGVSIILLEVEEKAKGYYRLHLEIPSDSGDVLRPGIQDWYLAVGGLGYDDYLIPQSIVPVSRINFRKEHTFNDFANDAYTYQIEVTRVFAYGKTFSSPKKIPVENQTSYLLLNAPPSGTLENGISYLTQKDMDAFGKQIFGEFVFVNSNNQVDIRQLNGEAIYSFSIGWDPRHLFKSFIKKWEDTEGTHYYYEIYKSGDLMETTPIQVLEYTIVDGFIWSCKDVSDIIQPSPYLE